MECKKDYFPGDEWLSRQVLPRSSWIGFILTLLGRDYNPENRCIRFFVKYFGMEYERYVKIVNELKERNDNIYKTVMVSINIKDVCLVLSTCHIIILTTYFLLLRWYVHVVETMWGLCTLILDSEADICVTEGLSI